MKKLRQILQVALVATLLLSLVTGAQAAAVSTQVVNEGGTLYYDAAGRLVQGASALGDNGSVVKMTKTVAAADKENEFLVTLQVQTLQDVRELSSTNPDAAVLLVLDVSNSMVDCLYCGEAELHSNHGTVTTLYYCADGVNTYERTSTFDSRCVNCGRRQNQHVEEDVLTNTANADCTYKSRMISAQEAAVQFLQDFRGTSTDDAARYVSIVTFGSSAATQQSWINITPDEGYNQALNALHRMRVANEQFTQTNEDIVGGGTNIEAGLMLGNNLWRAGLAHGGAIEGVSYQYTILLTDGNPTFYVSGTSSSTSSIEGTRGGGNETTENDVDDVGIRANNIRSHSSISKLYSICFGRISERNRQDQLVYTDVFNTTPFETWRSASPATTSNMTVGQWLALFSTAAYNGSAEGSDLFDAFDEVANIIQLEAKAWKVEDWMGDHIVYGEPVPVTRNGGTLYNHITTPDHHDYEDHAQGTPAYVWDLLGSNTDPELTSITTNSNGTFTGTLGYTFQYKVTLDNLSADYTQGSTVPVNNLATLKYVTTDENGKWPDTEDVLTAEFAQPTVKGLTGSLAFTKVNEEGEALAGAKFRLTPYIPNRAATDHWFEIESSVSDTDGYVSFTQPIPSGHTYVLDEIVVPDDYVNPGMKLVTVNRGVVKIEGLANGTDGLPVLVNERAPSGTLTVKKTFAEGSILPQSLIVSIQGKAGTATEAFSDHVVLSAQNNWQEDVPHIPFGEYEVVELNAVDAQGNYLKDKYALLWEIYVDDQLAASGDFTDMAEENRPLISVTFTEGTREEIAVTFNNNIIDRTGLMSISKEFISLPQNLQQGLTVQVTATPVDKDHQPIPGGRVHTFDLTYANGWKVENQVLPTGLYLLRETVTGSTPDYTLAGSGFKQGDTQLTHAVVEIKEKLASNNEHAELTLLNGYRRDTGHFHVNKLFFGDLTAEDFAERSIHVYVYDESGTEVDTILLNEDTNWTGASIDLPTGDYILREEVGENADHTAYTEGYDLTAMWYDHQSQDIRYLNEMQVTVTREQDGHAATYTVGNLYVQDSGSLTVTKEIVGADKALFEDITFTVNVTPRGSAEPVEQLTLAAPDWIATVTDLPVGPYGLTEVTPVGAPENYTFVSSSFRPALVRIVKDENATSVLTNTYSSNPGSITINKVLAGDENAFSASIDFTVTGPNNFSQTVTLTAEGQWTATIENLPYGIYSVTETTSAPGYSINTGWDKDNAALEVKPGENTSITCTNTYSANPGSITINKVLAGDENAFPASIDFTVTGPNNFSQTVTLTAEGQWTATIENLPYGIYSVTETTSAPGYSINTGWDKDNAALEVKPGENTSITCTNTYSANPGSITINKVLAGDENAFPASIDFTVTGPNNFSQTVTLTAEGQWTATIENLPYGIYSVTETTSAPGYSINTGWDKDNAALEVKPGENTSITCTNTYSANPGSITINKVLAGDENAFPASIDFTVTGPNNFSQTVTLTAEGQWTATVDGLAHGTYSVTETVSAPDHKVHTAWSKDNTALVVNPGENVSITCTNFYEAKTSLIIPVEKLVNVTGNVLPGSNTFTFNTLLVKPDGVQVSVTYNNGGSESGTIRGTGDSFTATVQDDGAAYGFITIDGYSSEINGVTLHIRELLNPYADAATAEANGWIYDQTLWQVHVSVLNGTPSATIYSSAAEGAQDEVSFTNTYTKTVKPELPPTGDNSNPGLWLLMMVLSIGLLAGVTLRMRRHAR